MMKFHFLTGDVTWWEYGGTWVSDAQGDGASTSYYTIEVVNLNEDNCNTPYYHVILNEIIPADFSDRHNDQVRRFADINENEETPIDTWIAAYLSYGTGGGLFHVATYEGREVETLMLWAYEWTGAIEVEGDELLAAVRKYTKEVKNAL